LREKKVSADFIFGHSSSKKKSFQKNIEKKTPYRRVLGFHETVNSLAQQLHGFARNDFFHEIPHHFCINTKPVVDEIANSFEIYKYFLHKISYDYEI